MLPVAVIAIIVMLPFWPSAWHDPLGSAVRALAVSSHQSYPYDTLFDGSFIPASKLPWDYLPVHIMLKLPELVLALVAAAAVLGASALSRAARRGLVECRAETLGLFLLGFAIVFPVAYAIAIKAVLFDGMRHFIFLLPPIAVAAALAADRGLAQLSGFRFRIPAYAALALYGAGHIAIMIALHPDQYVYYNALIGGVDGAERKFKLDYWANSYAEDVRGLETYLRRQYGAEFARRQFDVAVCGPPTPAYYYFPPNFHLSTEDKADFFIAFTKDNCDRKLPGRPVYQVERMGALLSVVIDRRAIVHNVDALRPAAAPPDTGRQGIPPAAPPFSLRSGS
jgi:hypothetical protein